MRDIPKRRKESQINRENHIKGLQESFNLSFNRADKKKSKKSKN